MNKHFALLGGPNKAKALSGAAVLAVLVATLWPLDPSPLNGVSWLKNANGLKFERGGIVVSTDLFGLPQTNDQESDTLEFLVQPASIKFSGTILAFYGSTRPARQLLVMRWSDGLLVTHDPSAERDVTGTVKIHVTHIFHPGSLVLVTISSGSQGTTVWVDGQLAQDFPKFKIARSDLTGEMVLGTSPTAYLPWDGEIRGLAIDAKGLTPLQVLQHYRSWVGVYRCPSADREDAIACYRFMERSGREVHNEVPFKPDLIIPATFRVPHKPFLESPIQEFRPTRKYAYELATNIAGFVPLGVVVFACFAWTRTRLNATIVTVVFCGLLSFAIEVLQYYVPRRGSGMTDVITNTLGAALGVLLTQSSILRKPLERIGIIPTSGNVGC